MYAKTQHSKKFSEASSMADDQSDDLDQLLDSALDDFNNLKLSKPSIQRIEEAVKSKREFPSLPGGVQGLGMGLRDHRAKSKGKQKAVKGSHVTEALDKLREQTREAFRGLDGVSAEPGADGLGKDPMMENWVKQFEELASGQDMGSMVETMMQQLLSKEVLYEPMREIGEKYPKWLKDNEATLSKEEYDRCFLQSEQIKELNGVYEKDPGNYNKIFEIMQKMQECGQPPNAIVQELAPDFDLASLGQISPEMLESQENRCIM